MRASLPGYPLASLFLVSIVALFVTVPVNAAPSTLNVALSESAAQRAEQVSNAVPVLAHVSNMTVNPGETADQTITATDADGTPLTFGKSFGAAFVTVTTTTPGTGNAEGNVHAAPTSSDAGTNQVGITVSDGLATVAQSIEVEVTGGNHAPLLNQPNNMTVPAGNTVTQELSATDSDGDPLSFYLNGPAFATVATNDPGLGLASGTLRLATLTTQATGAYPITVGVTDGTLSDEKSLTATVLPRLNTAPLFFQPENAVVPAGGAVDVDLHAVDAEHDALTFSLISGPPFVTVTTTNPTAGLGKAHIAPSLLVFGDFTVTVGVTDGLASEQKFFNVHVIGSRPPVLSFIGSMTVRAGTTATQSVFAQDPDGDLLTFSKALGPSWMTVSTIAQFPSSSQGRITLTPGALDLGTTQGRVAVTDGVFTDEKGFTITVNPANRAPALDPPSNMTVVQGAIAEQTLHAVDPDGDFIYFDKVSGPAYMQVFVATSTTGLVRLRPGVSDIGFAQATVRARDSFGGSMEATFQIVVEAGNFPPACPPETFVASQAPATSPSSIRTEDLDGDGRPDLVVASTEARNIDVYLGDGLGGLAAPVHYPAVGDLYDVAIGDFNGDIIPDLVAVNYYPPAIDFYPGLGPGTFGARQSSLISVSPFRVVTADLDRDGRLDLVTANGDYPNGVSIFYGNGAGGFEPPFNVSLNNNANDVAVGDLNQDGWPDVAAALPDSRVAVLNNLHNRTFSVTTPLTGGYISVVRLGDMNGDGKLDLIVTDQYNAAVRILLATAPGTFGQPIISSTKASSQTLEVADFNGDALLDVATAADQSVSVLLGDGTGLLGSRTDIPSPGTYIGSLAVADLDNDLRPDLVAGHFYETAHLAILLNRGCAPQRDRPPHVLAPRIASTPENSVVTIQVTASDADGDPITQLRADLSGLPLGSDATLVPNGTNTAGVFTWKPTYADARPTPYPVVFIGSNAITGSATTYVTVTNVNRAPVASPGGPYTAFADVALQLQGSGSADPDGDALTYAWVFGDGSSGKGPAPMHTYHSTGTFAVGLQVSDGTLTGVGTTTVNVVGVFPARAFTLSGNRTIRLNSGKPQWCVEIEPSNASFLLQVVDVASIRMKSPGTGSVAEIGPIAAKSAIGGDRDGNGVAEFEACFSKEDLRQLFSNLRGSSAVTVTIEGSLLTGGFFRTTMDLGIQAGNGGKLSASLSPNPLNPSAVLTLRLERAGPLRVTIHDVSGRLVRVLCDEHAAAAGYRDLTIDGRGSHGEKLSSGVYFYRIEAAEGVDGGRFTILK